MLRYSLTDTATPFATLHSSTRGKAILGMAVGALAFFAATGGAYATTCPAYTYTFSNGSNADASQVNSNFSTIMNCANTLLAPLASPAFTGQSSFSTTFTNTSSSDTVAVLNASAQLSPPSASASDFRSLNMSLAYETSASFSNTGADAPTAAWFENRILDSSTIAELDGAQFWGMWAGSDASSLGTVSDVEAAKFTPIESFSNSLTTTITKAVGVHVANASKNTFNLVGQAGILIDAISSGTNNTALLVGQSTVPTGNFAIYNASTNNNFFAGNVGIGTNSPIAVAGGTPALLQLAGSGALASEIVLSTNSTAASADIGEIDFATTGTSAAEKRSALIYSQLTSASGSAVSGNLVFDTNNAGAISQVVVMTSTARVGVGTSSPAVKLAVVGDIRVGTSGTNGCLQNFAGTALTGTCSSDAALKTVRSEVTGVLNKFSELRLVRFNWNNTAAQVFHDSTDVINTGFIAQDVAKQFPELVSLDAKGYRQLDYSTLSLYGLEAIKELKAKNDQQAEEIANLKTRLSLQDQRLSEIERRIGGRSADNNLSQIASQHVTEAR